MNIYFDVQVMGILRDNRDSVMAMLEAFVYDPLISWRLLATHQSIDFKHGAPGVGNGANAIGLAGHGEKSMSNPGLNSDGGAPEEQQQADELISKILTDLGNANDVAEITLIVENPMYLNEEEEDIGAPLTEEDSHISMLPNGDLGKAKADPKGMKVDDDVTDASQPLSDKEEEQDTLNSR